MAPLKQNIIFNYYIPYSVCPIKEFQMVPENTKWDVYTWGIAVPVQTQLKFPCVGVVGHVCF